MTAAGPATEKPPITKFGPDCAFANDEWVKQPAGLVRLPVGPS